MNDVRTSAQTEAFIAQSTAEDRDASYGLYKDPVRTAMKWRDELPPADIERVRQALRGSTLEDLYSIGPPATAGDDPVRGLG